MFLLFKNIPKEKGSTMVEYCLMGALIITVVVSAVVLVGTGTEEKFQKDIVEDAIQGALNH